MDEPQRGAHEPFLRITRHPYEEPHLLNLFVAASNGRQRGELEIYANAEDLTAFASGLRGFPKKSGDPVLWELGSERPEDRFAFSFRLRAFQARPGGLCAIEVRLCNNRKPPGREVSEFSIEAFPADLDRLADLLERFARLEHRVLEWRVADGELHADV